MPSTSKSDGRPLEGGFPAELDALSKKELVKECSLRGLPTKGLKSELVKSLKDEAKRLDAQTLSFEPPEGGFERSFQSFRQDDLKRLCATLGLTNDGDSEELAMRLDSWILCQTAQQVDGDAVITSVHSDEGNGEDQEDWKCPRKPLSKTQAGDVPAAPVPLSDTFDTLSGDYSTGHTTEQFLSPGRDVTDERNGDDLAGESPVRKARKLREADGEHIMRDASPLPEACEEETCAHAVVNGALASSDGRCLPSPMDIEDDHPVPSRARKGSMNSLDDFKLRSSSIAQLSELPLRPRREELESLTAEALIALISANNASRRQGDRKREFVESLLGWLVDHSTAHLRLPTGLHRRKARRTATTPFSLPIAARPSTSKPDQHSQSLQTSSKSVSTAANLDSLSVLLRHVGNVLHAAVSLGHASRTGEPSKNDFVALGQSAETTLSEVEAFSAALDTIRALPPSPAPSKGSSLAPGSWAQIAKTLPSGKPDQSGLSQPHVMPSRADVIRESRVPSRDENWVLRRCLIIQPTTGVQRTAKTDTVNFARRLEEYIRAHLPCGPGRIVELVRRTRRGDYQVQFYPGVFVRASEGLKDCDISLESFGHWKLVSGRSRPSSADLISLVVSGIPLSMSKSEFETEFAACNGKRFGEFDVASLQTALHSSSRLPRREVPSSGTSQWVPSTSIRCVLQRKLGEMILEHGSLVIGYRSVPVRPYHAPARICFHCGREGHLAKFCRSPAHCSRCDGSHSLRDCPRHSSHLRFDSPAPPASPPSDSPASREGASPSSVPCH